MLSHGCVVLGDLQLAALAAMFVLSFWRRELVEDRPFVIALGLIGCVSIRFGCTPVSSIMGTPPSTAPGLNIAPWIVMLLAVGLSIRHSLIFLVNRPVLGALLVGGGAPLSYLTGESFGPSPYPVSKA